MTSDLYLREGLSLRRTRPLRSASPGPQSAAASPWNNEEKKNSSVHVGGKRTCSITRYRSLRAARQQHGACRGKVRVACPLLTSCLPPSRHMAKFSLLCRLHSPPMQRASRLRRFARSSSLSYVGPIFHLVRAATESSLHISKVVAPPALAPAAAAPPEAPLPALPKHPLQDVHNFRDVGTSMYDIYEPLLWVAPAMPWGDLSSAHCTFMYSC